MTRRRKFLISEDQKHLPFQGGGILAYATPIERRVLGALSLVLFIAVACYIYFVMASVAHVASREGLFQKATAISAEVARLEAAYLSRSQAITEQYARDHGYVAVSGRAFVERASLVTLKQ